MEQETLGVTNDGNWETADDFEMDQGLELSMEPSKKTDGYLLPSDGRCRELNVKYVKNVFDTVSASYKGMDQKKKMDIAQLVFQMGTIFLSKEGEDTSLR